MNEYLIELTERGFGPSVTTFQNGKPFAHRFFDTNGKKGLDKAIAEDRAFFYAVGIQEALESLNFKVQYSDLTR